MSPAKEAPKQTRMERIATGQEAITAFLRKMQFKKRIIGGVEEEDVLDKMEHVTKMYQDLIENLKRQNVSLKQENSHLQDRVEQLQKENQENDDRLSSLQTERLSLLKEHEAFTAKAQENESERVELFKKAHREAQKILTQARVQAEELTVQQNRELERQLVAGQQEIDLIFKQRKTIKEEIDNFTLHTKASLQLISGDLFQMLNLTKELDGKMGYYRDDESKRA